MSWKTLKSRIKWTFSFYPPIFIPLYRVLASPNRRRMLIAPDTQIVIEGFPRSANTFALVAFATSQKDPGRVASHIHLPVQILEGVRRSLPVLVLIRNPVDAIRSLLVREPGTEANWAFQQYIQFYEVVERHAQNVIIARFEEVTQNFGGVMDRLNRRFGTHFYLFEHTEENVRKVYQIIEHWNTLTDDGKETVVARPSAERSELYEKTVLEVSPKLREQALAMYQRLNAIAQAGNPADVD